MEEAAEKAGVAEALIETHEMLAQVTISIMAVMFLYRLLLRKRLSTRAFVVYRMIAAVGLVAVSATGHTGGNLVYEHGAGVNLAQDASRLIAQSA